MSPPRTSPGLSREVQHDPVIALDGGQDGLALVARCITEAHERLAPGGRIALEIGHDQAGARARDARRRPGFPTWKPARDYQEVERFAFAVKP